MSFNSFGPKGFRPFEDKHPPYWKELLIATLPAFVASVMPPVVMHFLQREKEPKAKPAGKKKRPETDDSDAT